MGMPVMSGYELFYKLKQLYSKLSIIITSGFGEADTTLKIPIEAVIRPFADHHSQPAFSLWAAPPGPEDHSARSRRAPHVPAPRST